MPRPSPRCGKPSRKLLRRTVELGHPAHTKSRKLTGHCVDSHRVRCWVQIVWIGERCPSSLRKNDVSTSERRWSGCVAKQRNIFAGCSKRPFSKATASEEARRTLRYVEPLSEARTPLADFFSILLKHEFDADSPQMNVGMVCPVDGGVKIPGNRPRLIEPFLKGHIQPNRLRPEHGCSSARHHSQKPALAFTQESGSNGHCLGR